MEGGSGTYHGPSAIDGIPVTASFAMVDGAGDGPSWR
jgi:hypothetical protein